MGAGGIYMHLILQQHVAAVTREILAERQAMRQQAGGAVSGGGTEPINVASSKVPFHMSSLHERQRTAYNT